MLGKLLFLVAVILFVLAAFDAHVSHAIAWGLAAFAAGHLVEGFNINLR